MVNMTIVNNEQCVVGTTNTALWQKQHTPHTVNKPRNTKGGCRATCVLAWLRAHYTTPAIPQTKKEERKARGRREQKAESSVRRWRRSSR